MRQLIECSLRRGKTSPPPLVPPPTRWWLDAASTIDIIVGFLGQDIFNLMFREWERPENGRKHQQNDEKIINSTNNNSSNNYHYNSGSGDNNNISRAAWVFSGLWMYCCCWDTRSSTLVDSDWGRSWNFEQQKMQSSRKESNLWSLPWNLLPKKLIYLEMTFSDLFNCSINSRNNHSNKNNDTAKAQHNTDTATTAKLTIAVTTS